MGNRQHWILGLSRRAQALAMLVTNMTRARSGRVLERQGGGGDVSGRWEGNRTGRGLWLGRGRKGGGLEGSRFPGEPESSNRTWHGWGGLVSHAGLGPGSDSVLDCPPCIQRPQALFGDRVKLQPARTPLKFNSPIRTCRGVLGSWQHRIWFTPSWGWNSAPLRLKN